MDVPTITMEPAEAKAKVAAWLKEKHADARDDRADCLKGYRALAAGKVLIHLDAAIRGGGVHTSGFPKLAVARADRQRVFFQWKPRETTARFDCRPTGQTYSPPRGRPTSLFHRIEFQRFHNVESRGQATWLEGWAQVPMLPADVRPKHGQLKDWFILWEVERWVSRSGKTEPDKDPMLLEHVAGQLYAVLAEWELTELERAVMAGALRPEAS